MSGIYIHIPYCKQKCTYCDFHFSTNLKSKYSLIVAINQELIIRKNEIKDPIQTIYFGGGTPSILSEFELESIFETIYKHYNTSQVTEITLEINPDDISKEKLNYFKSTPINRFSIGIQSFFDEDLRFMNRVHSAIEAENSIKLVQDCGFNNITIDLIYGSPSTTDDIWIRNLNKAINLGIPHVSSYALTVEENTILDYKIRKRLINSINEQSQYEQFKLLVEKLTDNDFIQYEISNFGKKNYFSLHNSNYWKAIPYLGIGPSAHSYNGKHHRSWNISNNYKYIKNINNNILPSELEVLSEIDIFNESIMLGLRTIYGINKNDLSNKFSSKLVDYFYSKIKQLKIENVIIENNDRFILNPKSYFFADGIASKLFYVD